MVLPRPSLEGQGLAGGGGAQREVGAAEQAEGGEDECAVAERDPGLLVEISSDIEVPWPSLGSANRV